MPHRVKEFHSIMPVGNMSSVLERGILSHNGAKALQFEHKDISMSVIQEKREGKSVPNGLSLHEYVNLYFDARNPMMYKLKERVNTFCILKISKSILELKGVVVTDQNASSDYVIFLAPNEIEKLNLNLIYASNWNHPDNQIAHWQHKSAKCAEILVPGRVPPSYIEGAYVLNSNVQEQLQKIGFTRNIEIKPAMFFGDE